MEFSPVGVGTQMKIAREKSPLNMPESLLDSASLQGQ